MMELSDGRKSFRIGLAVLIQYRSVTDTQPATQPASHVVVAITLNAKASSLKTNTCFKSGRTTLRKVNVQLNSFSFILAKIITFIKRHTGIGNFLNYRQYRVGPIFIFRLDALALSVIATATWLAGWLGGWLGGCLSQPVLYQND